MFAPIFCAVLIPMIRPCVVLKKRYKAVGKVQIIEDVKNKVGKDMSFEEFIDLYQANAPKIREMYEEHYKQLVEQAG